MAAFVEKKRGPKNPHPNRVAKEIEEKILALCLERPTWGAQPIHSQRVAPYGRERRRHGRTRRMDEARPLAPQPAPLAP